MLAIRFVFCPHDQTIARLVGRGQPFSHERTEKVPLGGMLTRHDESLRTIALSG